MGIKNFFKFIKTKFPNLINKIHMSNFDGKKISVDITTFIYKYKIVNGDKWINSFIVLLQTFKKYNIHANICFDGKAPLLKKEEQQFRHEQKDKFRDKLAKIKKDLEEYYDTKKISELLKEIYDKYSSVKVRSFLKGTSQDTETFDVKIIEDRIEIMEKQDITITKDDIIKVQELLTDLGIPFFTSESEAEKLASEMCISKEVEAVFSFDSDCVCYNTPMCIFDNEREMFSVLKIEDILKQLKLSYKEFLDWTIMTGCDYNDNIPKIGIVNALKLIQKHKSIENIPIPEKDKECLRYEQCRILFTPNKDTVKAEYWKVLNPEQVRDILEKYTLDNRLLISFPKLYELEFEIIE